ncbi:MAG: putative oxidoreductase [Rickettsiales bacterium]|jgi:putative oxidoreductase
MSNKCEKMHNLQREIKIINNKSINILEKYIAPLLLLAIRIWIAIIFLKSGLTKTSNIDSTILLFEYEYALPIISPVFAAYSAIIFEIGCSFLLAMGIFSRLSALPLIVMTIVIQTLVFQNPEHFYWFFLLSTIVVFGGGKISTDYFAKKLICKFCKK